MVFRKQKFYTQYLMVCGNNVGKVKLCFKHTVVWSCVKPLYVGDQAAHIHRAFKPFSQICIYLVLGRHQWKKNVFFRALSK